MAGIDTEFVEKPPKAVQCECPVCLLVLREPYQATCCGNSFCKGCIEQLKIRSSPCPTCKTKNFFCYPNKGLQQSLYDFEVYCSQKGKGCEWRGELRELEKHLNSEPVAEESLVGCPITVIKCPLSHTGCEVKLPRKDMKQHINNGFLGHWLKLVQNVTQHSEYLTKRLQVVEREKEQLLQRVAKLEVAQYVASTTGQPIGPVEFSLKGFERQKKCDHVNLSPFFTHPHGYKMCLCVWPNGYANGKGTHLGVTIHLMRGEFDDHLKWPFRGDITYMLVDQEGEDHIEKVARFHSMMPEDASKRVVTVERNDTGLGSTIVVALSDLQPKYLKNDCIKLHVVRIELTY